MGRNAPSLQQRSTFLRVFPKAMNELTFFIHIAAMISFIILALRIGREALIAVIVVQVILANLFVTKQMNLFSLDITCSEVYTVGAIFSLNLLQTYFGKRRQIKRCGLFFSSILCHHYVAVPNPLSPL